VNLPEVYLPSVDPTTTIGRCSTASPDFPIYKGIPAAARVLVAAEDL